MAGGGGDDNPVSLNVTAMVDIIFCLCLFFMCSFHFKQLQGRIESWLPKDVGVNAGTPENVLLEEIRVILKYSADQQSTIIKLGGHPIQYDMKNPNPGMVELGELIIASYADYEKVGKGKDQVPVIIDAYPDVPWRDVINVLNCCKTRGMEKIQFAAPIPGVTSSAPGGG